MRGRRLVCRASASSRLSLARRHWSLDALLRQPTRVENFLDSVRHAAADSSDWDLDFNALLERGAAVGCASPLQQLQLMGRVGAALDGVLQARPSAPVRSLRLTLATPEAALTFTQLVQTTTLLSEVESVALVVDAAAVGVRGQDSMEGGQQGHEVTQLLHVLAERSARQPLWTKLDVVAREASPGMAAAAGHAGASLMSPYLGPRSLWDDSAVAALADLVQSKRWSSLSFTHLLFTSCSPDTRQRLWHACEQSADSLTELRLMGVQPTREIISSGLLRRLPRLTVLDVGQTQLDEDAVVRLLEDLQVALGGWWRLRHLGLAQCNVGEAVVEAMAAQLRAQQQTTHHDGLSHAPTPIGTSSDAADACASGLAENDATLAYLDISGARLSRTAVFALAGCLLPCVGLTHLRTRHCRLQAAEAADLATSLQCATGLRTWDVCLNRLGDDGVAALAKNGKFWPSLQEVDLTRCRLTCAGVRALSTALPAWDGLEVLRLVGNDLRCSPCGYASKGTKKEEKEGDKKEAHAEGDGVTSTSLFAYDPAFMKRHGSSAKVPTSFELERRDRAEGRRRYRGTEEFIEAAAAAARSAVKLAPLESLGEALALCQRLRVLDLSDAALSDDGLRQIGRYFAGGGAALRELRLAANPLFTSVEGLDALLHLLQPATQLTTLDLSFTGLGDLGVSMLCDGTSGTEAGVLTSMSELHTLQLSSCGVHGLGWESLTAALARLPALQHITLDQNVVEDVSLLEEFLSEAAKAAPLLQSVHVMGCVADPRAARLLLNGAGCRALRERGVQLGL